MVASTLVDLVKVQINSMGTTALVLGQAVSGFRGIEALIDGELYSYSIIQPGQYEVGQGQYVASGTYLTRGPSSSSNGNAPISVQAGALCAFTALAADLGLPSPTVPEFEAILQAAGGSELVGYQVHPSANLETIGQNDRRKVYVDSFIYPSDPDDSAAFGRAAAVAIKFYGTPGKIYNVKDVVLDARWFDGQNCVIRDAPGAQWGIKLQGYAPGLSNIFFQDQGNYVSTTTIGTAAISGATAVIVASAAGIQIGDVIFIDIDTNRIRHQTFVTNVSGTTITIRDALPAASAIGREVNAMKAAVWVGNADQWEIYNVLNINARGAFLVKPDSTATINNRGNMTLCKTDGCWYFACIKAENSAGVKTFDSKFWCGVTDHYSYVGSGIAGPYSFVRPVFLLRDVTVFVNGVAKTYLTHWTYSSQTGISFTAGNFPTAGQAIDLYHFRDGYRGFVEDQRNTAIISGGNVYDTMEVLDAFLGVACYESDLTEMRSLIADSCQYSAITLSACTNSLAFTGETFAGFSGNSLKVFGSIPKTIPSIYTKRVPPSEAYPVTIDDNVYLDGSSLVTLIAGGWSGEFQSNTAAGGNMVISGGHEFVGANYANVTGTAAWYLTPGGAFASISDGAMRAPRPGTIKTFSVYVDTAPGGAETFTYDVLLSGSSVGQLVITGASFGTFSANINSFAAQGAAVHLRLVRSTSASTAARHYATVTMI